MSNKSLGPDRAEVFKRKDGWGFRIKARNNRVIAASEAYTRHSDAVRGARRAAPGIEVRRVER